jgi:uncharacterized FlaG/YvyC family protein
MYGPVTIATALPSVPSAPPSAAVTANDAPEVARQEKKEERKSAIDTLADSMQDLRTQSNRSRLSIDHDAFVQAFVYRSIDSQTGVVTQQWPSEDALRLRRYMRQLAGLVVDKLA